MAPSGESQSRPSPAKEALAKIRDLKRRLAEVESDRNEPIAIVSTACRFPRRSDSPETFWQSLLAEKDEVSELPAERWDLDAYYDEDPDAPGKMYARKGAFLERIDGMDADFFGISPREATWIDPQQRLFLEVAWEAIERAGWAAERIPGDTGVFVGWMHNDYQNESSESLLDLNPYIATGSAGSFLCGRLSYFLGVQGPSLAVDTACSSSLVAVHLACQSLRAGECERAVVGGVNVMVSPKTTIMTCKLHALSPQGHSRAFDASADGYLRGEGCGVVTLRRLSDAIRDGDPVLAVVRGSAVTHNGFSSGLTAPNPLSQQRVIRSALAQAGVKPADVDYLEAHGTGTELGDPIEMNAAISVLGQSRSADRPLLVGSVKTNLGHLEAAAGIAGLIKTVLSIQHGRIPAHLHFETPNPLIDWERLPVKVVTRSTAWPASKLRIAGVSAFGMSGTNAHVVVSAPPAIVSAEAEAVPQPGAADADDPFAIPSPTRPFLVLSGRTTEAVRESAARYRDWLEANPDADLADVAYHAATGRRHFERRAAFFAGSGEAAVSLLSHYAAGPSTTSGVEGQVFEGQSRGCPVVAWQFTGQGSQYAGMGKELYGSEPVFRRSLDESAALLSELREGNLLEVMFEDETSLGDTFWTQPALFAIHLALAELMKSWGLKPDFVLGHSLGQYSAACVAGILDWREGLRLVHERSRLIGSLPSGGAMAAVFAGTEEVATMVAAHPGLSVAAHNGSHLVISGPETAVTAAETGFAAKGIRAKRLRTSHAFHSALLDPILDEFESIAGALTFGVAQYPLVCNVSGEALAADRILDGAYWRRHLREAVQYDKSVRGLATLGCEVILELGPQPILTGMAAACWTGAPSALIPSLQRDREDSQAIRETVARLYCHGAQPDFETLFGPGSARRRHILPTYPFQRQPHWGPERPGASRVQQSSLHPLLGTERALAGVQHERRFENQLDPDRPDWLGDHRVFADIIFPGAAFVEMVLAATRGACVLENLSFEMPLLIPETVTLQTVIKGSPETGSAEIYSSAKPGETWTRNLSATLSKETEAPPAPVSLTELEARCPESLDVPAFYEMLAGLGIHYGTEFQTIRTLNCGEGDVLARLSLSGDHRGFLLPPMLLDGALHSFAAGLMRDPESSLFLPVGIGKFRWFGHSGGDLWSYGRWNETEGDNRTADLTIFDESGKVVALVEKLKVRAVSRTALRRMVGSGCERLLYSVVWRQSDLPPLAARPGRWLVVGENREDISRLAEDLAARGQDCTRVLLRRGESDPAEPVWEESSVTIRSGETEHWTALLSRCYPSEEAGQLNGIVWSTQGPDAAEPFAPSNDEYAKLHCGGLLAMLRALRIGKIEYLVGGLQLITDRAVSLVEGESVVPESSQFWGLGRVIGNEYPSLRCRLVDCHDLAGSGPSLADVILTESRESQVALRSGKVHVPRLVPTRVPLEGTALPVSGACTYLITGGLGMLGRRAAEWLASRGAGELVLVSRSEASESALKTIKEIEATGCRVHIMHSDIGDADSVRNLIERITAELPPLRGIIHAAGVLEDGLLVEQSWEGFSKVLAPKKTGAWTLHELTMGVPLDFFILYSSAASVLGSPGQANYATANAFLDGLAHYRIAAGLPALSVNFGPWNEGMAATETVTKAVALQGMTPLTADEAHEAVERLVANAAVQATMLDVDWSRMRQRYPTEAPPLLDEILPEESPGDCGSAVLLDKLREAEENGTPPEEVIALHIQNELQQVLSLPKPPGPDIPLAELGLDSLMAVEFATRLQQQVGNGYAIPPTLAFDYPSVSRLTQHMLGLIKSVPAEEKVEPLRTSVGEEAVVIVGLGCRFPGADGPDAYWDLLKSGRDATCEIPPDRWDLDRFYDPEPSPGKIYTKRGGFLPDIGEFDAGFFGVSDKDAAWMDPQHRMLLEVSWQALEDAGIVPEKLSDPQVGVFMGIMSTDYAQLREQLDPCLLEGSHGAGLSHSAGVGRISYLFGFEGPSLAIDTASSSSLVAVCQAVKSLLDGDCHIALAGGANAILSPTNSLLLCKGGVLSRDGRSKSFSAEADGFGRGEGCGVVVLKRRSDAERDGDRILAVIRGTAIGHNGQNAGLTAPSGRPQQHMIRRALANAGIPPAAVHYLEAHATGTELGDSIEIRAAAEVFGKGRGAGNELLLGSAKANISHLEAAGGISGLIKVVLSMQHGVIPRQIHFETPSPRIPWNQIRVKVIDEDTEWPDPERPLAGVSALGMTGTNAHVILEGVPKTEAMVAAERESGRSHHLLVLSGASPEGLRELSRRYVDWMAEHPDLDLPALCDSAATGRRSCDHRLAIVAATLEEAREALLSPESLDPSNAWQACRKDSRKLAWVFADEEAGWIGMAKELYSTEPLVRETLDQCAARLGEDAGASLKAALFEDESLRLQPKWALPALFSVQMALARLWRSWGIEADLVGGVGVGQYAAACAAGMMDWEDGLRLAAKRGALSQEGKPISETALDELEAFADAMDHRPADRPILCNLTGEPVPVHMVLGGRHWRRHWEETGDLGKTSTTLLGQDPDAILEVGPPSDSIERAIRAARKENVPTLLRSLSPDDAESPTLLSSLAKLFVAGFDPDFDTLGKPWRTRKSPLPAYPFQRKRYWINDPASPSSEPSP